MLALAGKSAAPQMTSRAQVSTKAWKRRQKVIATSTKPTAMAIAVARSKAASPPMPM